jgi:hypothetical protein
VTGSEGVGRLCFHSAHKHPLPDCDVLDHPFELAAPEVVLMYMCKRRCPRGQGSHAAAKSAFLEQLNMLSGVNSAEFERGHSAPRVTLLFHLLHQGIMPDDPLVSSCPSQLNSATQLSMQCYLLTQQTAEGWAREQLPCLFPDARTI